uniref:Phosphatidylcholine transfer protein n=2 Tax=Lutzomyia longipalpis TaxID=7200 RepID=A0A1B0CJU8_LUTLO
MQPCGKFVYKVYGEYTDVSAQDFLHVQTDLEYRREWDSTAIALELIDTDTSPGSNSHVIYWEMLWPMLDDKFPLTRALAKDYRFEMAVGINGRIWICGHTPRQTIGLSHAILGVQHIPKHQLDDYCRNIVSMKSFPRRVFLLRVHRYFVDHLKNRSDSILRLWMDQCEYIVSQRIRRGQQMLSLYTKICAEEEIRELLGRLRRHVQRHAKGIMLSAVAFTFNWNDERITLESVREHFEEINFVEKLKESTLVCRKCFKRRIIDKKIDGIEYCVCTDAHKRCPSDWEPYLERQDLIIWRQMQPCGKFVYKVYGEYTDVSAQDFLHVQTDLEYRREWDSTAIALELIDTDTSPGSNSHVIYWEMLWPKLFANRDYVYNRRTFVDRKRQVIVIANRSTHHPKCPVKPPNQRVSDYWSYMVIKPSKSFKSTGLRFVLTYFDDPGIVIPPAKLFANRDYVYNRRTFVDRKRQVIVIANKSTHHPRCPVKPPNQRVSDYWSYMVIKPSKSFKSTGLRFVLTYFDDPGIKLFANRDYVYNRRTFVDRKRQVIVIANKSTHHPRCPVKPPNQRVSDYWSYMVIKPSKSFKSTGLRFVLTYFDDPGIVIPPAVTSWVARKQMPEFLNRLHAATLKYAQMRHDEEVEALNRVYAHENLPDPGYEYPPDPEVATDDKPTSSSSSGGDRILEEVVDAQEEEEEASDQKINPGGDSSIHTTILREMKDKEEKKKEKLV